MDEVSTENTGRDVNLPHRPALRRLKPTVVKPRARRRLAFAPSAAADDLRVGFRDKIRAVRDEMAIHAEDRAERRVHLRGRVVRGMQHAHRERDEFLQRCGLHLLPSPLRWPASDLIPILLERIDNWRGIQWHHVSQTRRANPPLSVNWNLRPQGSGKAKWLAARRGRG